MRNSTQFEEPCFLDYKNAPEYFHPRPEPPAGLTWWLGEWPPDGITHWTT
jgi:hypothetical protein